MHNHNPYVKEALEMNVSPEFLQGLMSNANLVRNISIVGHLHHGKTTLMDMFVEQTHTVDYQWRSNDKQLRYTDTRLDEQSREISVKAVPMSLVMQNSAEKSFLFNLMDTPGHVNFSDEVTASYRLSVRWCKLDPSLKAPPGFIKICDR